MTTIVGFSCIGGVETPLKQLTNSTGVETPVVSAISY
jgi:hypothetical protein